MKKIMIALLAIAVLFGFAACDNSNGGSASMQDQYVVALSATGPTEYFEGQRINVSDYTVTATQNDGNTFVVDSKDLKFVTTGSGLVDYISATTTETSATATEKVVGTIAYVGIFQGTQVNPTVEVKATVYKVDAIDVKVVDDQQTYYAKSTKVNNLENEYIVTAYALTDPTNAATTAASDAIYSDVVDPAEFAIYGASSEITTPFTDPGQQTLNFRVYGAGKNNTVTIQDGHATATLTVMNDYIESFVVGSVPASYTGSATVLYAVDGGTANATVKNYLTVTETMASGKVTTYYGSEIPAGYAVAWDSDVTAATTKFALGSTYGLTVTADTGANGEESPQAYELPVISNDIKSFTVTAGSGVSDIQPGDTISATSFTVTATWLDSTANGVVSDTNLVSALRINGNPTYQVPGNYPAETPLAVEFTLDGYTAKCTNGNTIETGAAV